MERTFAPVNVAVYIFVTGDTDTFVNNTSWQILGSAIPTNVKC